MFNKLSSKDDPAALAYEAAQRDAAGYEDEAWMIEHEPALAKMISGFIQRIVDRRDRRTPDTWLAIGTLSQYIRQF